MKRILSILPVVSAIVFALGIQGCEADVDLNNVDTSVKVNASVAVPIGSMHASLRDFVGDGTWGLFIENKTLTFKDTFSIERKFHNLELSKYISKAELDMNVYEKLDALYNLKSTGGYFANPTGQAIPITLEFPLLLKLDGINNDEDYQRLDSALIKNASFLSNIEAVNGLPLKWEWIDKVVIEMDKDFFHREAGNVVTVYSRGDEGGYGKNMNINVDEFSLNLMVDKHLDPTNPLDADKYVKDNVKDFCEFNIKMYVTIPSFDTPIHVPTTAGFKYKLDVQFIDYHAVWGMFKPSSDMSSEDEVVIADSWSVWNDLKSAKLPFNNPSIDMQITTQIAGALKLDGEYLYAKDDNKTVYAEFEGNHGFEYTFSKYEYLPLSSELGESKTMHRLFDKTREHGCIDKLFAIHPEKLGYKYAISFDRYSTPQIRITNNTSIKVDAVCSLPMVFNEGVTLDYSDTIRGVDLTVLNLDTLLADVTMIDTLKKAEATLALTFSNEIPFQIQGKFTCLDENNNVVIDPKTNKPLLITKQENILIPSPKYKEGDQNPKPVKKVETISVDKEDLETLRKVKSIVFYAWLDDKALSEEFQNYTNFTTQLRPQDGLRIKIAVGADVEAVLELLESNNEQ